jgi:hypothetical protein
MTKLMPIEHIIACKIEMGDSPIRNAFGGIGQSNHSYEYIFNFFADMSVSTRECRVQEQL